MNIATKPTTDSNAVRPDVQRMHDIFEAQKSAYRANSMPSAAERIERLARLRRVLAQHQDEIAQAICEDYGNRSIDETKIGEVMTCLDSIDYVTKNISKWMKPSKRSVNILHQPTKGWVAYQPLGVVGIMSPWNYPLLLSISPLICALSSGNHAMIKISSASATFGTLLEKLLGEIFPENLVAVVNGGGVISDTFCRIPFNFLVFTGSSAIGKTVMAAAAENLTPVLLELGGKSPAVIHPSFPIAEAAERIAFGKLFNAGQTCVAPDFVLVPRGKSAEFVGQIRKHMSQFYPSLLNNPDFTSIVNDKQYNRLQRYLDDARQKGAKVIEVNPSDEDFSNSHKIPPTLITNITTDMLVAQEELFGPILLVVEYDDIEEAIEYINDRPRPLALYYFDYNEERAQYLMDHTHSGQFGINTMLTHIAHSDLPFGGVGNSGMGKYHAHEGFLTMSHARSVLQVGKLYSVKLLFPPFNKPQHSLLKNFFVR
jgi:coniferyl-aldehyde dehydrogenase